MTPATARSIAGVGRVLLWNGGSLWIGRAAGSVEVHAHHAIQISLALSGQVKLRSDGGPWAEYIGALVHPHHPHQFDGCGESVAQLFVEPETAQGRALLEGYPDGAILALPAPLVSPLLSSLYLAYTSRAPDSALIATGQQAIAALVGPVLPLPTVDVRVTRVIEWLQTHRGAPVTLAQAARVAHLSPGRFRHLFIAQTGTSFRAYVLWLRIGSAIAAGMGGLPWTTAAQDGGFADSAHLSRTCRRIFGISPTMLVRE